jgi:hypothetical protein
MITTIAVIGMAMFWLGYETNWFTIRLPYGKANTPKYPDNPLENDALQSKSNGVKDGVNSLSLPEPILMLAEVKPVLLLDTAHFKPSLFETLDMPEFTGKINIVCERG